MMWELHLHKPVISDWEDGDVPSEGMSEDPSQIPSNHIQALVWQPVTPTLCRIWDFTSQVVQLNLQRQAQGETSSRKIRWRARR